MKTKDIANMPVSTILVMILLFLFLLAILFFLIASLLIGVGYILTLLFPFSLFESAMFCLATVVTICVVLITINFVDLRSNLEKYFYEWLERHEEENDEDYEEDDDNYEEDEYEEDDEIPFIKERAKKNNKVSRNAPCPCGSNRRYKKCCGKK